MVADLGVVMALFLGIVLSSLFAGEWNDNTKRISIDNSKWLGGKSLLPKFLLV